MYEMKYMYQCNVIINMKRNLTNPSQCDHFWSLSFSCGVNQNVTVLTIVYLNVVRKKCPVIAARK